MQRYLGDLAAAGELLPAELGQWKPIEKRAGKLQLCGCRLTLRDYFTVGQVRLVDGLFCNQPLLCPLCAIRRASKLLRSYVEKLVTVLTEAPQVRPWLCTFTIANGADLAERLAHLRRALRVLRDRRAMYLHGKSRRWTEAARAVGGVGSIEIKRGRNSGEWHPHFHAVWLCQEQPDAEQLRAEWQEITGDSHVIDVRPFKCSSSLAHQSPADMRLAIAADFCEVVKYALKFSELTLPDNWHAFRLVSGKRLVDAFGWLRGVEVDKSLLDEPITDADLPYLELIAQYGGGRYTITRARRHRPDVVRPEREASPEQLSAVAAAEASFFR